MFRATAKAVTRIAAEPQPKTRRRRSGEDSRELFPVAARRHIRRVQATHVYATASIFLSETLDWLNIWHPDNSHNSTWDGGNSDTKSNPLSPGL
jgi:hypothetical protein